jgi:hypothetical protein
MRRRWSKEMPRPRAMVLALGMITPAKPHIFRIEAETTLWLK